MTVEDHELCPRYVARIVSGVRLGNSPDWMQRRLSACGLRPVNNVVDITNYVMLETGQPLHAFDYDRIRGRAIVVRRAKAGEKIELLGGETRELDGSELVIADGAGPVALAGVMGGSRSEIGPATASVLLESAAFHGPAIRRTVRRLGLGTESSYRFERSTDWNGVEYASRRAAALLQEICGGTVASGSVESAGAESAPPQITIRYWRVDKLLGGHMEKHLIRRILINLGLQSLYESGEGVTFQVPSFRPDLRREADLIEEIARHYGYERLPSRTALQVLPERRAPMELATAEVRRRLVAMGFSETITTSLLPRARGQAIRPWRSSRDLVLTNPLRAGEDLLRQSLLPSLLEVRRVNAAARARDLAVFDLGRAYLGRVDGSTDERRLLAALDDRADGGAEASVGRLRAVLDGVLAAFGAAGDLCVEPGDLAYLEPGEGARLFLGSEFLGVMGRLAASLQPVFDLRSRPMLLEIDLDMLMARGLARPHMAPVPRFPGIRRDAALVLDEAVTWAQVAAAVAEVKCPLREAMEFVSLYRGKQLPAGKKSLALSVTYRAAERTLTDEEVNGLHQELVRRLTGRLGAALRA